MPTPTFTQIADEMAGQAFDGSIWVAGGQVLGLVGGSVLLTGIGAVILMRAQSQNMQSRQFGPPPTYSQGRRKMALKVDAPPKQQRGPQTIDTDRLENLLVDDQERSAEEALKDVSPKAKQ